MERGSGFGGGAGRRKGDVGLSLGQGGAGGGVGGRGGGTTLSWPLLVLLALLFAVCFTYAETASNPCQHVQRMMLSQDEDDF